MNAHRGGPNNPIGPQPLSSSPWYLAVITPYRTHFTTQSFFNQTKHPFDLVLLAQGALRGACWSRWARRRRPPPARCPTPRPSCSTSCRCVRACEGVHATRNCRKGLAIGHRYRLRGHASFLLRDLVLRTADPRLFRPPSTPRQCAGAGPRRCALCCAVPRRAGGAGGRGGGRHGRGGRGPLCTQE